MFATLKTQAVGTYFEMCYYFKTSEAWDQRLIVNNLFLSKTIKNVDAIIGDSCIAFYLITKELEGNKDLRTLMGRGTITLQIRSWKLAYVDFHS